MNTYINYRSVKLTGIIALILYGVIAEADEPLLLVGSGRTLEHVRVEALFSDKPKQTAQGCNYCDIYQIDQTTQIQTHDYQGSMDLALLKSMVFVRGSAPVVLADNRVQEARYVEHEE